MKTKSYLTYLTILMICLIPEVWGQTVSYEYDAAGNRKLRTKIINLTKSGMTKSATGDGQNSQTPPQTVLAETRHDDLLGERKVTIYPNPTKGLIRIEFQEYTLQEVRSMENARLLLYNIQGKLLRQIVKVEPTNTLDLSTYPAGTYILQMIEGKAKSEWKIVKE